MAGKQIANLDVGVATRTNVIAQQDATATSDANKITLADALGLIQVGDIPDLSGTYQEVSEKDSANGYAGLNASAKLPTSTIDQDSATLNQALLWDGSQWSPGNVAVNLDQSTIYVSKSGNDSNSGENINEPKLTISNAITTADTEGYSLVWVIDSGTYAEEITCVDGIDLYAPNATLSFANQQLTLAGQRTVIHKIVRSSGGNACILNTGAGDTSFLSVDIIDDSGSGVTVRNTQTTTLILRFGIIDVKGSGVAIADFTSGAHTHIYGQDIYLRSNGATGIQRTNTGLTVGYVEHIVLKDAATSTVAIDCNAGTLDINVNQIDTAVAYDVESGATLNLFVNEIASGTRLNDGTANVLALNSDSFLSEDLTVTDINSTNAITTTLTVDGSEIDTTGHSEGQVLMSDGTDFLPVDLPSILSNPIINPNFAIVQRQSNPATLTTYTDGSYSADRWCLLTQDANGQFGRITGDTQRYAGQLKKTASGTTRIGAIQWIEEINCYHLRGQTVTLQMRVRCSESSKTIRCGIVESTKTEDTITRDAISDWTTTPVSLIADYSFAGTPGSVTSDTTWQILEYTTTLGSSYNNLGILMWSETGLAQNATLDIEAVKLSISDYPTLFVPRSIADELILCQRYFETVGQFATGGTGDRTHYALGYTFDLTTALFILSWDVLKRAIPAISVNAVGNFEVDVSGVQQQCSGITANFTNQQNTRISATPVANYSATDAIALLRKRGVSAKGVFFIDAEL